MPTELEQFIPEVAERLSAAEPVSKFQRDSFPALVASQTDVKALLEIAERLNVRLNEHTQPKAAGCRWCEFGAVVNRIVRAARKK